MRPALYPVESKPSGAALDRLSAAVKLITSGQPGTGVISKVLTVIVELVLANTESTDAALVCCVPDTNSRQFGNLDHMASAPASQPEPGIIADVLRDPQSREANSGCFDLGRAREGAGHLLALRIHDGSETLTVGYARFAVRPSIETREAVQSICGFGGVLLTLARKSWMKGKAAESIAKFDSRIRDTLRLMADAYWEADETGIVRRVVLLDSSPETSRLTALEGKTLHKLLGTEINTKRGEFRDIRVTIKELAHDDIVVDMSGRLGNDGAWHGFMRPTKTLFGAAGEGETPRSLMRQIEVARDEEIALRRETETILDGLRILTSGKSSQAIFEKLLALFGPALEFSDAVILQRDWSGQISETISTLSQFTSPDWQTIGENLLALPDTASILNIPADLELPFLDEKGQPVFLSALAIKLEYGSKMALLLGLHKKAVFFRTRHLGLGMRLTLVARQAFINNEEQQKVLDSSKLATIGEMAAGIVHEINQPLTSMMLGVDNLKDKLERDGTLDVDDLFLKLERMQDEIERVTKIVASMRVLARRSDGVLSSFELEKAIRESLELMEHKLAKAGVTVSLTLNGPSHARGNHLEFGQVVLNLLTNAHDAMVSGAESPNTANVRKRRISISTRSVENGWIELHVRDTGGGFPAHVAENAFEPFFTTKKMGQGTGLGLALCRRIIENMGGTIGLANWAEGAEITVRLKAGDPPSG